ncbi:MAG: hypothetical protein E7662_08905 [Ruminococcaceae bacterium]|nr:hypothetical protein [Oscillospiraceae bacterium]
MMHAKRTLAALLASLMLVPALAACSDNSADTPDTSVAAEDTTTAETEPRETERHEIKDSLPNDLNFGGKTWTIYVSTTSANDSYVAGNEEKEGDIVNDAVWERNLKVQERLSFKMDPVGNADTYKDNHTKVSALILAGDPTYDLIMGMQTSMPQLVPQKMFVNAFELKHIDFDQPWWINDYMNELALGSDYRYILVSDFNTHAISYIRTNFFNKKLYEDLYGDPNELYKKVLDGKWMLEDMQKMVKDTYKDLNGDGVSDKDDQLGFYCNKLYASTDAFVYNSDVVFTQRDKDGFIELKMISDEAVILAEKLNSFFHEAGVNTESGSDANHFAKFKADTVLFITGMLSQANNLRDMESDYGFLPFPKINEKQEWYKSLVHDTAQLSCVPVSSDMIDVTGAILEAFSAESYRTVTPAWYESALKLKYARDDISSQIIDLMRDSMTTNFIYAYNFALNNLGQVYRTLLSGNNNDYVSLVTSRMPAAEKSLADIIKTFKGE